MKMHIQWTWITLLSLNAIVVYGGKILLVPMDGSHWINMKIIIEALHSKGHEITVVRSPDSWFIKENSPLYRSITLEMASGFDEDYIKTFSSKLLQIQREGGPVWGHLKVAMEQTRLAGEINENMSKMLEKVLENKDFLKSLRDGEYDIVLADPVYATGAILAHYLKLPLVFNARWTTHGEGQFLIAPSPMSYVPLPGLEMSDKMSFFQRVLNVFCAVLAELSVEKNVVQYYDGLVKKYLGPDADYRSLFQAADLWLMRVDFVFEFPRPTMPNVVYMGGFQCKPAKPLPDDLEEFVQSSGDHGVIIMSLGTLIGELPQDLADAIAAAFARVPQKVIWRHIGDKPANLGKNTLLVKWMPQNDVLGHPKIKLFVAHGGTNGIEEAIYHGVPILGIPLMFDQYHNMFRITARGAGKKLDITTLNEEIFYQGIQEVLAEPSYRMNMQRLSRLHRDTPVKPLDKAIFWIEFVMRHKGAAHLRTESYKMPWYSYHSVDVFLFLAGVLLLILFTAFTLIRCLFNTMCKKKVKKD